MKKLILSIAVLCYFVVTCGVVINFHYCMNRLASTSLYTIEEDTCGRCGMEMHESNGCCHDEVQVVKMQEDQQQAVTASYDIAAVEPAVVVPSDFIVADFQNIDVTRHFHNHSPPLLSAQDTYLQINVFRI